MEKWSAIVVVIMMVVTVMVITAEAEQTNGWMQCFRHCSKPCNSEDGICFVRCKVKCGA
ncbi:hypothetical protein F2Q69_00060198 [Brassica cretica]|uniref:Plant thionin family protein n=1 Tax=Brassica cretica TaxID=69181 RepID=A0A8S9RI61_BRACR|nr:hypothetical protein F2Q69_00060198 [Brassica cretica]